MGTAFTIDSPLRVARYGISSVISLVDDALIEQMRKFHCEREGEPYDEIADRDEDARARRITAYLDLVDRLVRRQVEALQASPFEKGSEITRYYEMLPETPLKRAYARMLAEDDRAERARQQEELRRRAVPGSIDVNIMTKLDRDMYRNGEKLAPEFADAMSALRGYARSKLRGSIIFSAGMNQRLYAYIAEFDDFRPDRDGVLRKKIVLKVSDFRSAAVQGRFLAKRGLWVSEYRVESGLNCGGHAFPSKGHLLGPILEEFRQNRDALTKKLHPIYAKALTGIGAPVGEVPCEVRITVQGGISTARENGLLLEHFGVDGTGWATPFLLVPEVVNVDEAHLERLLAAMEKDVYLSDSSPLDFPYWNLRTSASEEARRRRIREGKPGSPCSKHYAAINGEFTKIPICSASRSYVKRKLDRLAEESRPEAQQLRAKAHVLDKSCICHDLAGCAVVKCGIDPQATPAICPGPNIVDFSRVATLEEMVGHIYGRIELPTAPDRPHMFLRELKINVEYLRKEIESFSDGLLTRATDYYGEFRENLLSGVEHYRSLAERFIAEERTRFLESLQGFADEIGLIAVPAASPA